MPLPPALAARLAKRGIITKEKPENPPDEEVIAENYDNPTAMDDNKDEFGVPLPPKWEKVFESDFGTWYYWDTLTNHVSWLPPTDPEAVITFAAENEKLAKNVEIERKEENVKDEERRPKRDHSFMMPNRFQPKTAKKRKSDVEFDPMDPSAYSDAPRGNWSSGLKKVDDAKSGVDSTANGPLFQQRPYPSPGEVLSRNKQAKRELGPQRPSR